MRSSQYVPTLIYEASGNNRYYIDSENNVVTDSGATLSGKWVLDENHALRFDLDPSYHSVHGKELQLSAHLIDADSNAVHFQMTSVNVKTISLTGTLKADSHNKLLFLVKKRSGNNDLLEFKNTWVIDNTHRITYSYDGAHATKPTHRQTLTIKGYWSKWDNKRLYYHLEGDQDAELEFNVGIGQLSKRRLQYKLMIGSSTNTHALNLDGQWQITPKIGLGFIVKYADAQHALRLTSDIQIDSNRQLQVILSHDDFSAQLKQDFFNSKGNAFIKLSSDSKGVTLHAGFQFKLS